MVGTTICSIATSSELLVIGRFIQAFGGVAGVVLGRAIIRDVYSREKAASALGYVTTVMVIAPMIAPPLYDTVRGLVADDGLLEGDLGRLPRLAVITQKALAVPGQLPYGHAGEGRGFRRCFFLLMHSELLPQQLPGNFNVREALGTRRELR